MVSVVKQGGFQYKVCEGETLDIPLVEGKVGQEITLGGVLLLSDGKKTTVGTPEIAGAVVKAEIVEHGRAKKILVVKKHRRKDYQRRNGHRQDFTKIKITSIKAA
ncbi:MAG: 50S ribosomal protein L21 [Chitinivibrionia bacterium]|jgi:large subunit ribosomal protein L21|nr:50S ribosomal protein L21 [Chitinivibrionia bacterium]MCL1946358.1 50S ribosomal protein L21 [Chitinivibrionia bacterium]